MTLPSGAFFEDVALEQVDAKSPVDDVLMTSIAEDLYFLKLRVSNGNKGVFDFKVNGRVSVMKEAGVLPYRRIDGSFLSDGQTFTRYAVYLDKPGISGSLEVDFRAYRNPLAAISSILEVYSGLINSITRAGTGFSTQSISRSTSQVNTQSISYFKSTANIQSIVPLLDGTTRYNLDTLPDADYEVGDSVIISGASNALNDGTFTILTKNPDDYPALILNNSANVPQAAPSGTSQLQMFQYIAVNPLDEDAFVVGEKAKFTSHTDGPNNGNFKIYYVNEAANNLVVKNAAGTAQAGVAGTMDTLRWEYVLTAPASGTDLVLGEAGNFVGHTSGGNNGNFVLLLLDNGGNNVIIYNESGVAQGGAVGTVQSNRWVYALNTDPSTQFVIGESAVASGATNPANNGVFPIRQINRSATNNLVLYNLAGVTQLGAGGVIRHIKKLIKFDTDFSSIFTTLSRINITNTQDPVNEGEYQVVQVNRGGGSNFNVIIENETVVTQSGACGHINVESKSIFTTRPKITKRDKIQYVVNGVLGPNATVPAGVTMAMDVIDVPDGNARNLTGYIG